MLFPQLRSIPMSTLTMENLSVCNIKIQPHNHNPINKKTNVKLWKNLTKSTFTKTITLNPSKKCPTKTTIPNSMNKMKVLSQKTTVRKYKDVRVIKSIIKKW